MKKAKTKVKAESAAVTDAPLQRSAGDAGAKPGPGEFKIVPREKVRPDPNQPRKTFDETKLNELAESIRANGILSPLVVQLMPPKLRIEEPNMFHDDWQVIDKAGAVVFNGNEGPVKMLYEKEAQEFYQIVFGERRWRASELAGLKEIPVIVRELTEREVFVQQFVENNARENLTALDEAKAFQDRIAKEKETDPTFNAEKLAEALGLTRSTVYNRLVLTRLIQPVLDALTAGKIQTTVAGLIAMIPDPKQQEKLLAKITDEEDWQFPFSFRDVEELIEDEYCKQLKDAPFDLKNQNPFPGAQMVKGVWWLDNVKLSDDIEFQACETCPHRSGNLKESFPHIKNGNVCTKPNCYASKCQAHFLAESAAALKKGQKVMSQKEFKKVRKDYVLADDCDREFGSYSYWSELLGKKAPEPALIVTDKGLEKAYPKELAVEVAKKNGKIKAEAPTTPEERAKKEQKRKDAEARKERRQALVVELAPRLSECLAKLSDKLAWELAAEMIMSVEWPDEDLEAPLIEKAKGHKAKTLGKCFADQEWTPLHHDGDWNKDNVALWKRAGIDLIEEEKKRDKEAAQALPLPKSAPQQKELLMVKKSAPKKISATAREKIAAAAKARWAKVKAKANS